MKCLFLSALCIQWFCAVATAQANAGAPEAPIRHSYEECVAHGKKLGLHVYVAWVPGLAHTCLASKFAPKSARLYALNECEKTMRGVHKKFGKTSKCRIAMQQGRVVDSLYRRAWSNTPLPVSMVIFDAESGQTQRAKGVFTERVLKYKGLNAIQVAFAVTARGVTLCQGVYRPRALSISYTVNCFDKAFKGKVRAGKLIKVRGLYFTVPEITRLKSGKSWMEMTF